MGKSIQEYQFYEKLTKLPFVESVRLFGSRARGDNQERADIDLAVNCPGASDRDWFTVMDIIDDADTLLKIDCVRLDELDPSDPFKLEILEEGIPLYVRK